MSGSAALRVALLASGSAGNVALIDACGERILVDAGLSAETIERALDPLGVLPHSIGAILLTHEHDDHARGAGTFARTAGVPVFATGGTISAAVGALAGVEVRPFEVGRPFEIGPFAVTAFPVPHDAAEPVAFSIHTAGRRIVIATDLGSADETLDTHIADADLIVLESNYDLGLLQVSAYPWFLKNRILGVRGHLSNDDAARALTRTSSSLRDHRPRIICLAHLSEVNNLAALARDIVRDALTRAGRLEDSVVAVPPNGRSEPLVLD